MNHDAPAPTGSSRDGVPDLAPLLPGSYVNGDDAVRFAMSAQMQRHFRRMLAPVHKSNPLRCGLSLDDFVVHVVGEVLLGRIIPHCGLRATSGEVTNPWPFLWRVVVNAGLTYMRQARRLERREVVLPDAEDGPLHERADRTPTPEATTLNARQLARLREAALDPEAPLRHNLRFAFIAQTFPDALGAAHVDAAKAEAGRQEGHGILRAAEVVWALLEEHLIAPRRVALLDEDARLAFAWICRSRDTTDPETWRLAAPSEANRALDTIDEWHARARRALLAWLRAREGDGATDGARGRS